MKRNLLIIGLLFLTNSTIDAQLDFDSTKISKNTYLIVKEVAKYQNLGSLHAGFGGQSKSYLPQKQLKESGSISEFLELTKHPALMVRYIALSMLTEIDTFNYLPHITASLNKKETYGFMAGCAGFTLNYTNYLISLYLKQNENDTICKNRLDSLLVFNYTEKCYHETSFFIENNGKTDIISSRFCNYNDGKTVIYRDFLLINLPKDRYYYERLKELYKIEKNPILLYSIAKYIKDADTSILIKGLADNYYTDLFIGKRQTYWCFKAIYEHPKEVYFKHLIDCHEKLMKTRISTEEIVYYYLALLNYENRKTIKFLKHIIKQDKNPKFKNHRAYIWIALQKNTSDYFRKVKKLVYLTEEEKEWAPNSFDRFTIEP